MRLAHYLYVDRELHELKSCLIMGKFSASSLLSYSGLVVLYVTCK